MPYMRTHTNIYTLKVSALESECAGECIQHWGDHANCFEDVTKSIFQMCNPLDARPTR